MDASTAGYVHVEPIPHRDLYRQGTRGPQVPATWPTAYLEHLGQHGTMWRAAKQAGISMRTVERLRDVDPQFRQDEQDAVREHAESLEENLNRIASGDDMPAVTSNIVRLKKLDPVGYVERNLSISANFTSELPLEDGRQLLHAMLGQHGQQAMLPPSETP